MKIIKRIIWVFQIRSKIKRLIEITTNEREHFKSSLKWNVDNTTMDEKYLESRIEIKNEVLYMLRNLISL